MKTIIYLLFLFMVLPCGCSEDSVTDPNNNDPTNWNIIENSIGMKLVFIPPGDFMMGSPEDEEGRYENEGPQHRVKISNGFWMGIHEVTQGQWKAILGKDNNPSRFKGDNLPIEQVSWNDIMIFCEELSKKEGKTYRLPTEAEWEYACRSGTTTRYSFGDSDNQLGEYAWYYSNSGMNTTHPVGKKKPNEWGLYDMHGGVWELCNDNYIEYSRDKDTNLSGTNRTSSPAVVLRGGSWGNNSKSCRSARRVRSSQKEGGFMTYGFRVVLEVESGERKRN